MSLPATLDLELMRGDSHKIKVTAKDDMGAAIDLSGGVTIKYQLAKTVKGTPLVTMTVGSGITITNAATGQFEIKLLPANTAGKKGAHYHECELTDLTGEHYTIFTGAVTFQEDLIV